MPKLIYSKSSHAFTYVDLAYNKELSFRIIQSNHMLLTLFIPKYDRYYRIYALRIQVIDA